MRLRSTLAIGAAAALVAALPAHAATKTLDGKKTKVLTFKDTTTAPQDHDTDLPTSVVSGSPDKAGCVQPRCGVFSFVYKPAKGVKRGPFSARIAWTVPGQDYDLYVIEDGGVVGQCGAPAGTSEVVVIPTPDAGHKYTIVIDHYRSVPDTITATVSFPAKDKVATTVPGTVDTSVFTGINCGIS